MQNKPQAKIKSHVSVKIASIRPELGMSAQGAKETRLSGTQEKGREILWLLAVQEVRATC